MLQKSSLKIGTVHIAFFASRFPELRYLLHHLIPTASSQGGGKVHWQRYHARWTCPASVVILIWRQTWPVEWLQPRWTCHHHWGAHQSGDGETKTKSWKAPGGTPLREATRGICQGIYLCYSGMCFHGKMCTQLFFLELVQISSAYSGISNADMCESYRA